MTREFLFAACAVAAMIALLFVEDWVIREDTCVEVVGHVVELGSRDCDNN